MALCGRAMWRVFRHSHSGVPVRIHKGMRQADSLFGSSRSARFSSWGPPDPFKLLGATLEHVADNGRQAVNLALAATGSSTNFERAQNNESDAQAVRTQTGTSSESLFWNPFQPGSPFLGREAFLTEQLAKDISSSSTAELVPEADVEEYVDVLLSGSVLANNSLPFVTGRELYIRVVRIALRVIVNGISMMDGGEMLGKQFIMIKQPSLTSKLRRSGAPLDIRFVRRLAARAIADHLPSHGLPHGAAEHAYLSELGLPRPLVARLYEDIIALTLRLVLDICLTFKVRCLGHALTCQIAADDMLHMAPGWEAALNQGAFGTFDDGEKRRWAHAFVQQLLRDESVRMSQLPESLQEHLYIRVALVMLNLAETALNHFRIHVAGMSFRPALVPSKA